MLVSALIQVIPGSILEATYFRIGSKTMILFYENNSQHGQSAYFSYQGNSIINYFLSNTDLLTSELQIRDNLSLNSSHKFMNYCFNSLNSLLYVYMHLAA